MACSFGCSGNLKNLCKEKSGKCLFYLTLCIIHEYQFIFSDVMCSFATDCMGKVSALLLVRIPLLMVDVRLKIRALEPVFVWLDQSTVLYLDEAWWALFVCERDSGSSSLFAHQLLFLAGEFVYDHIIFTQYTDALFVFW